MSQRPKTDKEVQSGRSPEEWEYYNWYNKNYMKIMKARSALSEKGTYDKLMSDAWPDPKDRDGFVDWLLERARIGSERLDYQIQPRELLDTIAKINFLSNTQAGKFHWTMEMCNVPFIILGQATFDSVSTCYGLQIGTEYLWPNLSSDEPDVTKNNILAINLAVEVPVNNATSTSKPNPVSSLLHIEENKKFLGEPVRDHHIFSPEHFVFVQLGALCVFTGDWTEALKEGGLNPINKGPWEHNNFGVALRIDARGNPGAVYVIYNFYECDPDLRADPDENDSDQYPGRERRANSLDTRLVAPGCKERFAVAKIANSLYELGDIEKRFEFEVVASGERQIVRAKIWESESFGEVITPVVVKHGIC
ncbi:hypothetical protein NW762_001170 [Fusarium torreyae]|uniref:Uncharacterized protein n=1 Tax=Fusarium torreyae TaxID=1237075 RepID=A0A9W8VNQ3_9HYPO|nr:hypothetical protein NW762_001170 [Fusarium torreyae]